jgi:hypothetical protein
LGWPTAKWIGGAHWRLVWLVKLACPPRSPAWRRLLDRVGLANEPAHRSAVRVIGGLVARRCASQEPLPARCRSGRAGRLRTVGPNEILTLSALLVLHAAGWSARSC